jgi:ABC-type nitrate/sulfonate/bicarbonate transport system substrate-binding protein
MKMRKRQLVLLGPLLTILVNCSSPSPPSPPLKIAVLSVWPTYETIFIAQDRGLFAKYGVSVTPVPVAEYMEGLKLYKENQVDATFLVFADAIILAGEGMFTRFVYATDYSENDVIMGQPTLNGLSDLKGKKVSFEGFNTFSHLLVLKLLEKAGIQEGEFQSAAIDNVKVLNALETGKIVAGHVYGAVIPAALAKGYKILGKVGDIYYLMVEGLAVKTDIMNSRHEEVQGVVKALLEAMAWFQQFPIEGVRIIAKHNGASETELANIFKGLHILTLKENQKAFKPDGLLFKGGKEISEFFHQKGTLAKVPDLNVLIDGQFLNIGGDKP